MSNIFGIWIDGSRSAEPVNSKPADLVPQPKSMTDPQPQHGGGSAPITVVSLDYQDRFRRGELLLEPGDFGLELIYLLLEGVAPGRLADPALRRQVLQRALAPGPCVKP